MAGTIFKRIGIVLLTMLKWMLQSVLLILKLAFGTAKLFLLFFALAVALVLVVVGVPAARR